jgi:hypothetical protein
VHYAEFRYAECHYVKSLYAECHYAECRLAECRGAFKNETGDHFAANLTFANFEND